MARNSWSSTVGSDEHRLRLQPFELGWYLVTDLQPLDFWGPWLPWPPSPPPVSHHPALTYAGPDYLDAAPTCHGLLPLELELPFPLPVTTSDHSTHGKHPKEAWKDHLRNPSLGLILLPKTKTKTRMSPDWLQNTRMTLGVWKWRSIFVLTTTQLPVPPMTGWPVKAA